jgi:hypothetical protein
LEELAQPEYRSKHNGKGTKKQSYTLAEKQEYVKIYQKRLSNSTKHRGLISKVSKEQNIDKRNLRRWIKEVSLDPVPNDHKKKRKFKDKKEPDSMEKYAVDYTISRREKGLPVNASLVAIALKRRMY